MTSDDDWSWLQDLPEAWVPPDEMMEPTDNPRLNLPIKMLSSRMLGNDVIDLVGRFVSEGARFNMWFATNAKGRMTPRELTLLSSADQDRIRRCYEAWRSFADAFDAAGRRSGSAEAERAMLVRTLSAAVDELINWRSF